MEQGEFSRVKVRSKLSVVSGKPTEPGKVHQLSKLDQAMELHTIHIVFYYGSNPFGDGPELSDLDNLRVSLSQLLDKYPVVTGRLARGPDGGWQIKFNDAGVRIIQASVSDTLDEWLRSADASEERDLTVWDDMPQDPTFWSPFRIQINYFKCGGVAIGLSCTHMQTDITSATLFIKSWSEVHRGLPHTHPPTFHLPPLPPNSTPPSPPPTYANAPPKMATATLKFSDSAIKKHISQVQNHCPAATPFDVLAALFWSRIAHYQNPPLNDDHSRSLTICTDSRNQGDSTSSIPYGYFGNALRFSTLTVGAHELQSGGLGLVSDYIHRHIAGLKGEDFGPFVVDGPVRMYGPRLTCVNAEHMVGAENGEGLMYGAVFSKGEGPVHVSYNVGNVEGDGLIMVMPSAEGGLGRAVTVVLPEEEMGNLCRDEAVLDLEPSMVHSGKFR